VGAWREGALVVGEVLAAAAPEPAALAVLSAPLTGSAKIAVACSGGADSLAALLFVWARFPQHRERLLALTFDHGTRPDSATAPRFVGEVARALDISVLTNAAPPVLRGATEGVLRAHRLRFFCEQCAAAGAEILVEGHHANDVVETLLMRLARGSGTGGMSAPRPVRRIGALTLVRPLLTLPKRAMADALTAAGLPWCEDVSNAGDIPLRNRLRHAVVPAWIAATAAAGFTGDALLAGAGRSRRLFAEDDAALEAWLDSLWSRIAENAVAGTAATGNTSNPAAAAPRRYRWTPLAGLPPALHRRALWRVLLAEKITGSEVNARAVDAIVAALADGAPGQWSVGGLLFKFDGAAAQFSAPAIVTTGGNAATAAGDAAVPFAGAIAARIVPLSPELLSRVRAGAFSESSSVFLALPSENATAAGDAIRVRHWCAGDAYRPLGAPGRRNLSDLFIVRKIPRERRHALPVVTDAATGEILWVPGLPPAHSRRLGPEATRALRLDFEPSAAAGATAGATTGAAAGTAS
jgi:tRNA(Ile)-lysidine synthase